MRLSCLVAQGAAFSIYKGENRDLPELIDTAGAVCAYVVSRTIGMPGMRVKIWLEATGVLLLITEALFSLLALVVLRNGMVAR